MRMPYGDTVMFITPRPRMTTLTTEARQEAFERNGSSTAYRVIYVESVFRTVVSWIEWCSGNARWLTQCCEIINWERCLFDLAIKVDLASAETSNVNAFVPLDNDFRMPSAGNIKSDSLFNLAIRINAHRTTGTTCWSRWLIASIKYAAAQCPSSKSMRVPNGRFSFLHFGASDRKPNLWLN